MNKRVLLAGTSYSAAPILDRLKAHGYTVAVCGALPDDPCHSVADHSFLIDYSQRENLLDVVRREKFDYLCPSCNDYSYLSCAWVAEQCGLPGYDSFDTTVILHNKSDFRSFLEKNGFPTPRMIQISDTMLANCNPIAFPVLAKPVDSFSGRGVTKVLQVDKVSDAVDTALTNSRTGRAILEEFVEGSLHSHSAFIKSGEFIFDTFVDEYCSVYPYQVDCSNAPSFLSKSLQTSVRECMRELASLMRLNNGLLHTQFIVKGNEFWLIESMRRCPGDLYYRLVELSTGVNGHDLYIRPFIDKTLPEFVGLNTLRYYARHTISVAKPSVIFSFSHTIPGNDVQIVPLKPSGHVLKSAPYDKLGIIFAAFSSSSDLWHHAPQLADYITIQQINRGSP